MSEVEIFNQLSISLNTTALFGIMWAFLLWVAGRSATVAIENNAGIIMKIAVTVFGLVSLYQFNIVLGILIAYFSNYLLQGFGGNIDWRYMLGVEAIPSLFFLTDICIDIDSTVSTIK